MTDDHRSIPSIPEVQLHQMLSDLLSTSDPNTGALDEDKFWHFVAALGQGRGITESLHAHGLEAVNHVAVSPRASFEARKQTAYHAGLLMRLLLGIGRALQEPTDASKQDDASILPGNFNTLVVAGDLLSMQEGHPSAKPGKPQLLRQFKNGEENIRAFARRIVVGAVLYRMARFGRSNAKVREELDPYLEKPTWERWQREFGGPTGEFAQRVKAQAEQGESSNFDLSDEKLSEILAVALSGPGRGRKG